MSNLAQFITAFILIASGSLVMLIPFVRPNLDYADDTDWLNELPPWPLRDD